MALKIKENHGVFSVEGSINTDTSGHFQSHFEMLLNAFGELTIDIEKVSEIDANGVSAIQTLYKSALNNDRGFMVIGNISKTLYNELRTIKAAA